MSGIWESQACVLWPGAEGCVACVGCGRQCISSDTHHTPLQNTHTVLVQHSAYLTVCFERVSSCRIAFPIDIGLKTIFISGISRLVLRARMLPHYSR